jgi:hypothetical protein
METADPRPTGHLPRIKKVCDEWGAERGGGPPGKSHHPRRVYRARHDGRRDDRAQKATRETGFEVA